MPLGTSWVEECGRAEAFSKRPACNGYVMLCVLLNHLLDFDGFCRFVSSRTADLSHSRSAAVPLRTSLLTHAEATRRFNGEKCTGVLTKKLIYFFGGRRFRKFDQICQQLQKTSTLKSRLSMMGRSKNRFTHIYPEDCNSDLGIVSCPGNQWNFHEFSV